MGDRLGGHILSGHVDQTGKVVERAREGNYVRFEIRGVLPELARFLHKKGSVGVQGVSLTVNEVVSGGFSIMLVPHTLERTTLDALKEGSPVNLEMDWMTKVILNDAEAVRENLKERK